MISRIFDLEAENKLLRKALEAIRLIGREKTIKEMAFDAWEMYQTNGGWYAVTRNQNVIHPKRFRPTTRGFVYVEDYR